MTGFTLDAGAQPPSGLWVSVAVQARVFSFSSGRAPLASALMSKLSYCVHPLVLNLFFFFLSCVDLVTVFHLVFFPSFPGDSLWPAIKVKLP